MPSRFLLSLVAALAIGTPAFAGGYRATLATPAAEPQMIARDLLWTCDGATCRTRTISNSRPRIVCQALVRKAGPVSAFVAEDAPLAAADLAACNAVAR
jgi:hypothetical protein